MPLPALTLASLRTSNVSPIDTNLRFCIVTIPVFSLTHILIPLPTYHISHHGRQRPSQSTFAMDFPHYRPCCTFRGGDGYILYNAHDSSKTKKDTPAPNSEWRDRFRDVGDKAAECAARGDRKNATVYIQLGGGEPVKYNYTTAKYCDHGSARFLPTSLFHMSRRLCDQRNASTRIALQTHIPS